MNILVACEESQAVTIALRKLGHVAFSCDIEPCSGGHPEWHIQADVLPLVNGNCSFTDSGGGAPPHRKPMGYAFGFPALHLYDQRRSGANAGQGADRPGAIQKDAGSKGVFYAVL